MPETARGASWAQADKVSLAIFVLFALLIGAVLLVEVKTLLLRSPGEALNHVLASGGFTLAASGILLLVRKGRPSALTVMAIGAAITVFMEAAQAISPARDAETDDLLAGLSGVLVAAIAIEVVFSLWQRRTALQVHVSAASLGTIALIVLLFFNWSPRTVRTARPDGVTCPLTAIHDSGRLTIGNVDVVDGCLRTESGGLGLVGPWNSGDLFNRSVLVSSDLHDLRDTIQQVGFMRLRTEIVTDEFDSNRRAVIALLRTNRGDHIVNLRATKHRLEVNGPNIHDPLQASAWSQRLEANTRYVIDVHISRDELLVHIDDEVVGRVMIEPQWHTNLDSSNLQLLIGNNAHRSTPFTGTIEWVELST